jgi:hypothetical protein
VRPREGRLPGGYAVNTRHCATAADRPTLRAVTHAVPPRSGHCAGGDHESCPHYASFEGVRLWRPRPTSEWTLHVCRCACHAGCALAGADTVRRDEWRQGCTCQGAARVREDQARAEQRRREVADVLADVRRTGHADAAEVEGRLRAVFLTHGETPPPGLTAGSRVVAAGTARRGTRTARLLWMGVGAVARTARWAWQPGHGGDGNRAVARKGYRSVGVIAAVAAVMTVAASTSAGTRRRLWAFGAAVTWLAAGWTGALVTAVTQLGRATEERVPDRPPCGGAAA